MSNDYITVLIPDSLGKYHNLLWQFFNGMVRKLDINSHKETPTMKSIPEIIDNLREEVVEFEEQLALDKWDENSLIELMDAANFAFLTYVALRLQGVEHGKQNSSNNAAATS